jgi:RNA polymerase sigma factor (sigma-70 family)
MSRRTASEDLEQLVARAAQNDVRAKNDLVRQYWPVIQMAVRGRRRSLGAKHRGRDDTADLMQDAAMRVLRELPRHEWRGHRAFVAWIKRLTDAEVIDAQRYHLAAKRDVRREATATSRAGVSRSSIETRLDQKKRLHEVSEQIATLKPEQQTAIFMHCLGYAHGETGELLGCSPEAARKLLARALAKLADMHAGQDLDLAPR